MNSTIPFLSRNVFVNLQAKRVRNRVIMKEPEIKKADVSTKLELPMYDAIAAGFPITSDYVAERLDFNRDFIKLFV